MAIGKAYEPHPDYPKGSGPAGVNFDDRQTRDPKWKIIYWVSTLAWFVLVIIGVANGASMNIATSLETCQSQMGKGGLPSCDDFGGGNFSDFNSSSSSSFSRRLQEESTATLEAIVGSVITAIVVAIVVGIIAALAIGAGWMHLLSKFAKQIVYATVLLIPTLWAVVGIALIAATGQMAVGLPFVIVAVLMLLILFCIRNKLKLTAALITEAMHSFKANYSIFCWGLVFVAVLALVGLISLAGIVMVVMSSEWKVYSTDFCERCDVEFSTLQRVHAALILIWLGWTSQLMMQIRMYIIGAATGIWYFHEDDARAATGVRTGMKWAFTTSFGTNVFAALVLYIVNEIKRNLERKMRQRSSPLIACIAWCIMSCIGAILEFFNTFLVVVCAVTGDDFCTSCKTTYHMLSRNLLSALVVDSVSEIVLGLGAFVFALVVGGLGGLIAYGTVSVPNELHFVKVIVGVVGGVFALIMGLIILFYFAGLALNFISAVFVCYAMDKDQGNAPTPAHAGVHECFAGKHIDPATGKPAAPGAPAAEVPMAKAV